MADGSIRIDTRLDNSDVEKGVKDLKSKLNEIGDSAKRVGENFTKYITTPLTLVGGAALKVASDFDSANARIKNSLGLTGVEAEKLTETARNIWKNGFGENLDDVTNALLQVKQNIKGIDDGELEKITQGALVLAQTWDADVNEVTRAGGNLVTNFGISAEEAFNLLANGAQNGLNFSNELFDNVAEYAPLFADAGYSSEEFFTLLQKGAEKGIYNLDYLNDVVKEFGIRIADGSKGTEDALAVLFQPEGFDQFVGNLASAGTKSQEFGELVSLVGKESAEELVKGLQKGGKSAEDTTLALQKTIGGFGEIYGGLKDGSIDASTAMDLVISKLNEIDDPVERNTLGVQLFGTKWEDLGADVVLSLGGVKGSLLDVDGTLQSVIDTQEQTFGQQFQSTLRETLAALEPLGKVLLDFAQQILPYVKAGIETLSNIFASLSPVMQVVVVAFGAFLAAIGPILVVVGSLINAIGTIVGALGGWTTIINVLRVALGALTGPIGIVIATISALIAIGVALYQNWDEILLNLTNIWNTLVSLAMSIFTPIGEFFSSLWNGIVDITMSVWNGLVTFFTGLWNSITNIFTTVVTSIKDKLLSNWNLIKDDVTNAFNNIMNIFKNTFEIIKNIVLSAFIIIVELFRGNFDEAKKIAQQVLQNITNLFKSNFESAKNIVQSVFNTIKTITTTSLNAVKNAFSTSLNFVINFVKTTFNAIVASIKTAFTAVLNFITNTWSNITSTFKTKGSEAVTSMKDTAEKILGAVKDLPGKFLEIGENIIKGLINGIGNLKDKAIESITGVVDGLVNKAKSLLDIHSPSRVFKQIGLFTGEGLVIGIEESEGAVKNATESLVGGILDVTKEYQKEYTDLQKAFDNDRTKKNDDVLKKIQSIEQAAAKKKRSLTKSELAQIKKLEDDYRNSKFKSEEEFNKKYSALVQKADKNYLDIATKSLEEQRANYGVSKLEEVRYWNNIIEIFTEGSNERLKATQNYNKAVETFNKEFTDKEKEYVEQVKAIDKELVDGIAAQTKIYTDELDKRTNKLDTFATLFQEFNFEIKESGQDLINNLQSQVDGFKLWEETIDSLFGRNILSDDLKNELSELGVSALPQLLALNSLTDEQLTNYSNLFDERSKQARERAEKELIGLKFDTEVRINELRIAAEGKLDLLNKSWQESMLELTRNTSNELGKLQTIGSNAGQGLLNGLASMEGPIVEKARSIAAQVAAAMASALDIHSPSRVTEDLGMWTGKGFEKGIDESIEGVVNASVKLANASIAPLENANQLSNSYNIDKSQNLTSPITVYGGDDDLAKRIVREQKRAAFGFTGRK